MLERKLIIHFYTNFSAVSKRIGYGYRDDDFFFTLIRYLSIPSVRYHPTKIVMNHFFYQSSLFVLLFYLIFKTTARVNFIFSGSKL